MVRAQIPPNLIDDEISVMYPPYKHFDLLKAEQYENCCRLRIMLILMSSRITSHMLMKCHVMRGEIEASLNFKYSPSQIAELKKDAKYQPFLLDEFINRRMKKSRLACIALT